MNPASLTITKAVTEAIQEANRGTQVIDGDSVVDGLLDVLALFVAQSPYMAGPRSRADYFELIEAGLKTRVAAIAQKRSQQRGFALPGLH